MKRRDFLTRSITASALAMTARQSVLQAGAAENSGSGREFYELRTYRLKEGAGHELLDNYLEKALVPALNRTEVKPVGVFIEQEPKDGQKLWVLMPYASLEAFAEAKRKMRDDAEYRKAGAEYFESPKDKPAFDRIDSWFHIAFSGMPKLEQPAYSREKKARIFEMRTYESHSELKAIKKVEMFNSGEIELMHEVGLGPVFYGQAVIGHDLPHLTYMLSAEDREAHKKHWSAFGGHATWKKMSGDPQYKDTVSKITSRFLVPTAYSQI